MPKKSDDGYTGEYLLDRYKVLGNWAAVGDETGLTNHQIQMRVYRIRAAQRAAGEDEGDHPTPEFATPAPPELSAEELIALARQNQKAAASVDPIIVHETITLKSKAPIGIIFASCMHLGSRYVNYEAFEKLLSEVLKIPRLYWLGLGDDTEGFTAFFDAASAHEQALADPKLQRKLLAHVLDKLAAEEKLLCGFSSQHGSQWVDRRVAEDPIKRMYLERKVPYFDGQAYIKLKVAGQNYKLFGGHKLPGHSQWNRNHPQKRAAVFKAPTADVVFMGDAHVMGVQQETLDTFEYLAGERPSPYRWLVQVSALKNGPEPYTIQQWSPAVWDWPIMIFRHDRHEVAHAADLEVARLMLNQW